MTFSRWCMLAASSVVFGCSGNDQGSSCGRFADGPVYVLTWNAADMPASGATNASGQLDGMTEEPPPVLAERQALGQLQAAHTQCNPQSRVELVRADNREEVMAQLVAGSDADVAIVNSDQVIKRMCQAGLIRTLEDFERQPEFFARHIRDQITLNPAQTADGPLLEGEGAGAQLTLCAVPIAQHQLNRLFVNLGSLPGALDPNRWTSLEGFLADLEQLPPTPLFTVAGKDHWTLSLTAFENVMIAAVGYERYREFWTGYSLRRTVRTGVDDKTIQYDSEPDLQAFEETMVQMDRLRPYMDVTSESKDKEAWQDFVAGQGSFYVMGNWRDPDTVGQPNIARLNFPGTDGYYVFTVDAMVIPSNARDPQNGFGFARTVTDPTVNWQYNEIKGSDSVLASADQAIATQGRQYVEGLPLLLTAGDFAQLQDRVTVWLHTGDKQQIIDYVRREYCSAGDRLTCPTLSEPRGVH